MNGKMAAAARISEMNDQLRFSAIKNQVARFAELTEMSLFLAGIIGLLVVLIVVWVCLGIRDWVNK